MTLYRIVAGTGYDRLERESIALRDNVFGAGSNRMKIAAESTPRARKATAGRREMTR